MNLIEHATVVHYHRQRIARFGLREVRTLGWQSDDSQRRRFERIAAAADFTDASVLDLGCGTGDLKPFLDERFADVRYLGVDVVPDFVDEANRRFAGDARARAALGHFQRMALPTADHVVACGSLSYRCADPRFAFRAVARMLSHATRSVVLCVLDKQHFPEHPLLVGQDIDELVAFCEKLSADVQCLRGTQPEDVTLVLRAA